MDGKNDAQYIPRGPLHTHSRNAYSDPITKEVRIQLDLIPDISFPLIFIAKIFGVGKLPVFYCRVEKCRYGSLNEDDILSHLEVNFLLEVLAKG